MADLTDDDLELATTVGDRISAANRRAYVDRDTLNLADRLQRAALELQRHRALLVRLENWASQLEDPGSLVGRVGVGHFIAAELRNRIRGGSNG